MKNGDFPYSYVSHYQWVGEELRATNECCALSKSSASFSSWEVSQPQLSVRKKHPGPINIATSEDALSTNRITLDLLTTVYLYNPT